MIYRTCSELPLSVFIKVVTTDDISFLSTDKKVSKIELAKVWADIYSEYFELCASSDCKHMINTVKAIAIAENKIVMINAAVAVLRIGHSDKMYDVLSRLGFKAKRFDNYEERGAEMDRIISRAKSLVHVLNEAERQLSTMENGKKATVEDYTNSIVKLGKYQGYRIDPEHTSVAEYLAIQKNYKLEQEWLQKKV